MPDIPRSDVRWYHQSWAVIGGLLLIGGFFAMAFASPIFLFVFELMLVGAGLWLFFGMMDRTLTSDRPAILEMKAWLDALRSRSIAPRPDAPALPDHGPTGSFFLHLGIREEELDLALACALEPYGELLVPRDAVDEAAVRDLARRARLVFTGSDVPAWLREDALLWSKTVLLVPPDARPDHDAMMADLRRLDVNLPPLDERATGFVAAARCDGMPLDPFPVSDPAALAPSLLRARPDLVHGPSAAPGAQIVVDTRHAPRSEDGALHVALWLQPSEARLGTTRSLLVDGRELRVIVPPGTTAAHELRITGAVAHGDRTGPDLVLDIEGDSALA